MVEREREEGEARAVGGGPLQLQQEGVADSKADGEREDEKGVDDDEQGDDIERAGEKEEEEEGRQEEEVYSSEIRLAIEELSPAKKLNHVGGVKPAAASPPPTLPFLGLSHLLLRVLDKIGPTMAVLRLDVQRNIERLQELYLLDPCKYSSLTEIVEKEVKDGTARKVDSCSRAVLWLTRSMDFTVALLQRLGAGSDQQQSLAQHVEAAYSITLKPWHGWISAAAYTIAMKLIPEMKVFTSFLMGSKDQDPAVLKDEIEKLATLLQPLLDDIHSMMAKFRLDRLKST